MLSNQFHTASLFLVPNRKINSNLIFNYGNLFTWNWLDLNALLPRVFFSLAARCTLTTRSRSLWTPSVPTSRTVAANWLPLSVGRVSFCGGFLWFARILARFSDPNPMNPDPSKYFNPDPSCFLTLPCAEPREVQIFAILQYKIFPSKEVNK